MNVLKGANGIYIAWQTPSVFVEKNLSAQSHSVEELCTVFSFPAWCPILLSIVLFYKTVSRTLLPPHKRHFRASEPFLAPAMLPFQRSCQGR